MLGIPFLGWLMLNRDFFAGNFLNNGDNFGQTNSVSPSDIKDFSFY